MSGLGDSIFNYAEVQGRSAEQVLPKEEGKEVPPPIKVGIVDVLYVLCGRGFLRAASRLCQTSKAVAAVAPMGTGRQVYDAAKSGNDEQLTTYLEYWRGNNDSPEVLNWAPMVPGAAVIVTKGKAVHSQFEDSPLRAAVLRNHLKCVELLTSCAPAVDVNKGKITNPLHYACRLGRSEIVCVLLTARGIQINMKTCTERTPLHEAADNGHAEIVRMLGAAKGIELRELDCDHMTPLEVATEGQHQEVVAVLKPLLERLRVLIEAGTKIVSAIDYRQMDELQALLEEWSGNEYVLNWAYQGQEFGLLAASRFGYLDVVRLLASTPGVDVHKVDPDGFNALMMAARRGKVDVVRFLLTLDGIDLNKKALANGIITSRKSALGLAKKRDVQDTEEDWARKQEVVALLREAGAEESEADAEVEEEEFPDGNDDNYSDIDGPDIDGGYGFGGHDDYGGLGYAGYWEDEISEDGDLADVVGEFEHLPSIGMHRPMTREPW